MLKFKTNYKISQNWQMSLVDGSWKKVTNPVNDPDEVTRGRGPILER